MKGRIFRPLASGPFSPERVKVFWDDRVVSSPSALRDEITRFWRQQAQGPNLFNGRMARLAKWQKHDSTLRLWLQPTDYATLLYSNASTERIVREWGEEALSRALGISAVVISADDRMILMQRSLHVGEFPNRYDVFGGHIDVPEPPQEPSIFKAMEQELTEELALSPREYELILYGLLEALPHRKPELVFAARCRLTAAEIMEQAREARDRFEYQKIFDIPMATVRTLLTTEKDRFSPSAFGSIWMYLSVSGNS